MPSLTHVLLGGLAAALAAVLLFLSLGGGLDLRGGRGGGLQTVQYAAGIAARPERDGGDEEEDGGDDSTGSHTAAAADGQARARQEQPAFILHGRDTEATFADVRVVDGGDDGPGMYELWVRAALVCVPPPSPPPQFAIGSLLSTSTSSSTAVRSDICDGDSGVPAVRGSGINHRGVGVGEEQSDYPLLFFRVDGQRRLYVPGVRPRVHNGDSSLSSPQADPPLLAGRLALDPIAHPPTVTVQLTFPRTDAEALIFSAELRRVGDALAGGGAPLECPPTGPRAKVDVWFDDHLPTEEEFLQDEKHPIRSTPENAYVAKLKKYRQKFGGHALKQTPQPAAHCPASTVKLRPLAGVDDQSLANVPTCPGAGAALVADLYKDADPTASVRTVLIGDGDDALDALFRDSNDDKSHTDTVSVRCLPNKRAATDGWKKKKLEPNTAAVVFARDIFNPAAAKRARRVFEANKRKNLPNPPMHVVLLSLDSLSRSLFYSSMPQTQRALRAIESAGRGRVYDFRNHRTSGHGTAGNAPAYMAGSERVAKGTPKKRWLFDQAREFGFATLLSTEECMFAQNSFPRLQAGFPGGFGSKLTPEQQAKVLALTRKSADHSGLVKEFCNVERMYRNVKPKWWDMSARMCYAGKYMHEHILDYAGRFLSSEGYASDSVPLFASIHLNAGHESTLRRVRTLDEGVARFLDRHAALPARKGLRDTAVVLISDHGLGYGQSYYAQSTKAKEDYFNPTFMVILPESFARARPEVDRALRENTARMTGHFDVYKTVWALLGQETTGTLMQGASLFDPLTKGGRSCKEIGVPVQACPCTRWKAMVPVKMKDGLTARAAGSAIAGMMALKLNSALPASSSGSSCLKWLSGSGNASNPALKLGKFSDLVVIAQVLLHTSKFGVLGDQEFSVKLEVRKEKKGLRLGAVEDVTKAIGEGAMKISHWFQVSKWGKYEKCAPKGVPLNACACV